MAEPEWSDQDQAALILAVGLLEKETLTDTLLSIAGAAANAGIKGGLNLAKVSEEGEKFEWLTGGMIGVGPMATSARNDARPSITGQPQLPPR